MKCKTHGIELRFLGTVGDIVICPACMREREAEPSYGIIPFNILSIDELSLFENPEISGDHSEVKVDLSIPANAASFFALCESRATKELNYDAIQQVDILNRTITLKG